VNHSFKSNTNNMLVKNKDCNSNTFSRLAKVTKIKSFSRELRVAAVFGAIILTICALAFSL